MRTFEQYLREAVDFRLGGSSNKGDAAKKSFKDLEKGDSIFIYIYKTKNRKPYIDIIDEKIVSASVLNSSGELFLNVEDAKDSHSSCTYLIERFAVNKPEYKYTTGIIFMTYYDEDAALRFIESESSNR